jgi:small-conductance mechanosensitive channel
MFNVLKKEKSEEDVDSLFEEAMNFILPFYRMIYFLDTSIVNIDKDKLLFVKYEDLVSGDVKSVQELEKFLGATVNLKDSNESVTGRLDPTSPFYSENYGQPATTQSIGKYRDSLTFEQIVDVEHVFSYYMDRLNYGRIGEPGFRQLEPQKNLQRISDLQRELQKSQQQTLSLQRELQKSQQQTLSLQRELQKSQEQFYSSQHELQTSQQQVSSLQKELQQKLQETSHLNATLSRMPLASEELTIEKAEESLRNLYAYYYSKELPEVILLFERITKINARLIAANLCLRYGRYKRALEHLLRVGMMDPLALFSVQAIRITGNGLIHRRQRP